MRLGIRNLLEAVPNWTICGEAVNGQEAVEKTLEYDPDIVIMDINLPGPSGIDCIRAIRDRLTHTQFMMFTVYENDEKVFEALQAGASGYLLKTAGGERLGATLRSAVRGEPALSRSRRLA